MDGDTLVVPPVYLTDFPGYLRMDFGRDGLSTFVFAFGPPGYCLASGDGMDTIERMDDFGEVRR